MTVVASKHIDARGRSMREPLAFAAVASGWGACLKTDHRNGNEHLREEPVHQSHSSRAAWAAATASSHQPPATSSSHPAVAVGAVETLANTSRQHPPDRYPRP